MLTNVLDITVSVMVNPTVCVSSLVTAVFLMLKYNCCTVLLQRLKKMVKHFIIFYSVNTTVNNIRDCGKVHKTMPAKIQAVIQENLII